MKRSARARRGLAAAGLITAVLTGCASPGGPATPAVPTNEETTPMAPADPPTRLTIVVKESAEAEPTEYILECDGATPRKASTLPDPGPACATVARLGVRFFTALPSKNMLCTEQYGGPQTARVSGTIDGEPVNAAFARTNGCEISRWDAAKGIVGPGGNF